MHTEREMVCSTALHNISLLPKGSLQCKKAHLGRADGSEVSLMHLILHALAEPETHTFGIYEMSWNVRLSSEPLHSAVYSVCLSK